MKSQLHKSVEIEGSIVECDICAFKCKIENGGVGKCGVIKNELGATKTLVGDRLVAFSIVDNSHKNTTVLKKIDKSLAIGQIGCNYKCTFCNTWDISQFPKLYSKEINRESANMRISQLGNNMSPSSIVEYAESKQIKMITYTFTEPTISIDFYVEVMKYAQSRGILNYWETNGYLSESSFSIVTDYLDGVSVDLKSFSNEFYRKHCSAELSIVKENIRKFVDTEIPVEIITLLIPGENDCEKEIERAAIYLSSLSKSLVWKFKRFSPDYRMLDKEQTSIVALERAVEIGRAAGLLNSCIEI